MRNAFVFAMGMAVLAPAVSAQEVLNFDVAGTNLDGSPYGGTAQLTILSDSTCSIVWTTAGVESTGVCMVGQNAFAAAYVLDDALGLVIYDLMEDGSLQGTWTITGMNGTGTEILTPAM